MELIAIAYALTLLYGEDTVMLRALAASDRRGKKPDAARLIVETIYFDEQSPASEKAKRNSAWAMAVRHLIERQVLPSVVPDLAKGEGEGIDAWSKAKSHERRLLLTSKSSGVKTGSTPDTGGKITVRVGTKKRSWRIGNDAALERMAADAERLSTAYPAGKTRKKRT